MKALIALLFLAALPLFGQRAYISQKQIDSLKSYESVTVNCGKLDVLNFMKDWILEEKFLEMVDLETDQENGMDAFIYKVRSKENLIGVYGLSSIDEKTQKSLFIPDTGIYTTEIDRRTNKESDRLFTFIIVMSEGKKKGTTDLVMSLYWNEVNTWSIDYTDDELKKTLTDKLSFYYKLPVLHFALYLQFYCNDKNNVKTKKKTKKR